MMHIHAHMFPASGRKCHALLLNQDWFVPTHADVMRMTLWLQHSQHDIVVITFTALKSAQLYNWSVALTMQPNVRSSAACTYLAFYEQESPDIVFTTISCMQTPRAPPLPVAAFLSPILWRLNNPDKFDMYSVGVLFLQMVFPNLRR